MSEVLNPPKVKKSKTLASEVSRVGVGLFTGIDCQIKFRPLNDGKGIFFQRMDLPGFPILPARFDYVNSTPRCTIIGHDGVSIQTVEHLLAALFAFGVDNLLIQLTGPEVPIFDGSSKMFIEMIEEAGLCEIEHYTPVYQLDKPIYWSKGDIHIIALPSDELKISYSLHYPQSKLIGSQFFSISIDSNSFKNEISACRTFSLYEEIAPFIEKGLLKGGSLDNAVLIKEDQVMNPDGLRFSNEMVRHKILDMIGDLSLLGFPFQAHLIAIKSGHAANNAFARELYNHKKRENI